MVLVGVLSSADVAGVVEVLPAADAAGLVGVMSSANVAGAIGERNPVSLDGPEKPGDSKEEDEDARSRRVPAGIAS